MTFYFNLPLFANFSSLVYEQIPFSVHSLAKLVVYEFLNHFFQVLFCHFELLVCWGCILCKYLLKCHVLVQGVSVFQEFD